MNVLYPRCAGLDVHKELRRPMGMSRLLAPF